MTLLDPNMAHTQAVAKRIEDSRDRRILNGAQHLTAQQTMRLADHARIMARAYDHASRDMSRPDGEHALTLVEAERWTHLADFLADSGGVSIVRHRPRNSGSIPGVTQRP